VTQAKLFTKKMSSAALIHATELFCRKHVIKINQPNKKAKIIITRKIVSVPAMNMLLLFINDDMSVFILFG
jgi:hypothetical protein